jgi:hypothetical protein
VNLIYEQASHYSRYVFSVFIFSAALPPDVRKVSDFPKDLSLKSFAPRAAARGVAPKSLGDHSRRGVAVAAHQAAEPHAKQLQDNNSKQLRRNARDKIKQVE